MRSALGGLVRTWRPRVRAVLLAGCLLAFALPPSPASAADVVVTLSPAGKVGTTLTQGETFNFKAIIENTSSTTMTVEVFFELVGPNPALPPVTFSKWKRTMTAGSIGSTPKTVNAGMFFEEVGTFQLIARHNGVQVSNVLELTVLEPPVQPAVFEDVTAAAGISTSIGGNGNCGWTSSAAWGDVDGDSDLDLYIPQMESSATLWINDGSGHFTDQAAPRGVASPGGQALSATFADYDNDGDQDLYVAVVGTNRLYLNDGTGYFTDVTALAGVPGDGATQSASWADYDMDGDLDLYATNYGCRGFADRDYLYRNEGNGTFTDVTALVEHDPAIREDGSTDGNGFQAIWFDYDDDGDLDLYLAQDFWGPTPDVNHLWRNDGPQADGTWLFTDVSVATGLGLKRNSMGAAVGSPDRDLDSDVIISNIGSLPYSRNDGGVFTQVGKSIGLDRTKVPIDANWVTWGLGFFDLNHDGWEDLAVAAGPAMDLTSADQPDAVFINHMGTFLDLSAASHANDLGDGRGLAFADYDRDGDVDMLVVNKTGSARLYENVTPMGTNHWLQVDPVGTASNRDGCGAKMVLTIGAVKLLRQLLCGSSLGAGNDTVVHFGLGTATTVDELVIYWPSGTQQTLTNLAVDQLIQVTEPSGP